MEAGLVHKHLLEQPAFEVLGLGDLGGNAFDLPVEPFFPQRSVSARSTRGCQTK